MLMEDTITTIINIEEKIKNKKIIIFGTGNAGKVAAYVLKTLNFEVEYFVDSDPNKTNSKLLGKSIFFPDILLKEKKEDCIILVASMFYNEISKQLISYNYCEEVHFFNIGSKPKKIESNPKKIKEEARKSRVINGVTIGKYSYGCEKFCFPGTVLKKVGAFCSINRTVKLGFKNHPTEYITTHPFLYGHREEILSSEDPVPGLFPKNIVKELSELTNKNGEVTIGNDVWMGEGVIVLPGVNIGNGAIIGAGAVVTKDIPDYAVAVGVPAEVIKFRFSPNEIKILNLVKWWDWSDEEIIQNADIFYDKKLFFEKFSHLV